MAAPGAQIVRHTPSIATDAFVVKFSHQKNRNTVDHGLEHRPARVGRRADPRIGLRPDAMEPGFHGVRTRWIRAFMAFQVARRRWRGVTDGPFGPRP